MFENMLFRASLAGALLLFGTSVKSHNLVPSAAIDGNRQSVGLVLSGGGAKGIAEIGVIKALEENHIPIDYITGTSMGAIVGSLYACGYTPDEMMELILSPGFASWSTGKIPKDMDFYFNHPQLTPDMLHVNLLNKADSLRSILPSSLISPLPMNFAFMELFAAYSAQCGGDFNNLFVPFRCVTSDVYEKHKVVLSKGDLGDCVRASMSFPTVFQPIYVDGFLAFDGGLYDNFPVDVMLQDFAPDILLGVDVSGPNPRPPQYDLFQQLEDMIMQKSDYNVPPEAGIRIKIDTDGITLLQFPRAKEIYERGYKKAMEMMDSIKKRVSARVDPEFVAQRRVMFKEKTPKIKFDKVHVTGGTDSQNDYIQYIFDKNKPDTFGIDKARDAYYRAVTTGRLRNLEPHAVYDSKTGLFDLNLKSAVRNNLHVGIGGYITTSVNSMLYLSAGYSTLSFNSFEGEISGWLGQSYMAAMLNARLFFTTEIPSALSVQSVVSRTRLHQNDKLFYEDREPVFINDVEAFARLNYGMALGRTGDLNVSAGYGYIRDSYSSTADDLIVGTGNNYVKNFFGQLRINSSFYTLDYKMFPTAGHSYKFGVAAMTGYYTLNKRDNSDYIKNKTKWIQVEANVQKYWDMGRWFSLGLEGNLLASTRKLLSDYNSSIVTAYAFNPTASSNNAFHSALRSMSFITAGITPILKFTSNLQFRATAHCFMPFRAIERVNLNRAGWGKWFRDPKLFAEAAIVYNFPFASLAGYVDYIDSPGDRWTCGLSFGLYFTAPKFLRN